MKVESRSVQIQTYSKYNRKSIENRIKLKLIGYVRIRFCNNR